MSCKKGSKLSEEHKKNISISNKGRSTWITGIGHSANTKKKMSESKTGKKRPPFSKEWIEKLSLRSRKENNPNWQGGVSTVQHLLRESRKYRQWRSDIFERDNFKCVIGGKEHGNKLNADHIKPFFLILRENKITTTEDGFACEELWNLNNGRTLCENCHKETDSYGWKYKNL